MISRFQQGRIGLPSFITVALGRGDGWSNPKEWYKATGSANATGSPIYVLADMNDDEMADVVVINDNGNGLNAFVFFSTGTSYSLASTEDVTKSLPKSGVRRRHLLQASASAPLGSGASAQVAGSLPELLSQRQRETTIFADPSDGRVSFASYPGAKPACTAAVVLKAWPHTAPECLEDASLEAGADGDFSADADGQEEADAHAHRRRVLEEQVQTRRMLQSASASAGSFWLGTLPDHVLDCSVMPLGYSLVQNLPGQQIVFACTSGKLMGHLLRWTGCAGQRGA